MASKLFGFAPVGVSILQDAAGNAADIATHNGLTPNSA